MPEYNLADIFAPREYREPELPLQGPRLPRPVPRGTPAVFQPGGPPPGVPEPWSVDGFPRGATYRGGNLTGPFQGEYFNPDGTPTDALLDRLRYVESGGNDSAVSPVGAQGPYQIMPDAAVQPGFGVRPMLDPLEAFDPTRSRQWAAEYLTAMYRRYRDPRLALAAYNAGPGAVDKHGGVPPFQETQNYVGKFGF